VREERGRLERLRIERLVFQGNGFGRMPDGRVAFVPLTAPGDDVEVRIREARHDFVQADLVRVLAASADRVAPPCRYFGTCGGCQWQHLTEAAQRAWKGEILREQLRRVGRIREAEIAEPRAVGGSWGYRGRAQLKVVGGARPALGFHQRETNRVVDIADCPLLDPRLNALLTTIRGMRHPSIHQLFERVRELWLSVGTATGEGLVSVFAHARDRSGIRHLFHALAAVVPGLQGVTLLEGDPRQNPRVIDRHGSGALHEQVGPTRFQVDATAFFQVSGPAAQILTDLVLAAAGLTGRERVLDLYCGVGTFTLPLARSARAVVGIEAHPAAAADAVANAQTAGVPGVRIVQAQAEQALAAMAGEGPWDLAVLDPPRPGCSRRLLAQLARLRIPRLIYVSCDPSTLARDLGVLHGLGYRCERLQPVDLFPQTFHLETVAVLAHGS
jgi:23S rRNA (uracil1939-C5)-methyltransferase